MEKKPFDQLILKWFAGQIPAAEQVLEIGSGPGEVSGFLSRCGTNCVATDRSGQMIAQGKKYFPSVQFEVQDFLALTYSDYSFRGVVGFYAIVNLEIKEIKQALQEVNRVLKPDGLFLFSFHIYEDGIEEQKEIKNFFDAPGADMTFYFFRVDEIKTLVEALKFKIEDILIRYPYPEAEYPSKRAYFVVRKKAE